jgi:hypothetical protein
MNRHTLPQFTRLLALATFSMLVLTAAAKPIHPSTLGTGGPILIAIVGDHYLAGEEDEFNYDVENFVKRGLLLDSYYKDRKNDWRFVSYFEPTDPNKESRYGFKVGFGDGNCAVMDNQDPAKMTMELLSAAVGGDVPRHTIVIGNHPYNFGCSKGDWTYVAAGAVGTDVLQHEFGHRIAWLWDEWVPDSGVPPQSIPGATAAPYFPSTWSPSDTRNCWPKGAGAPTPHWHSPPHVPPPTFSGFTDREGCEMVAAGVIHPYDHCRMGASHVRMFCDVCKAEMDKSFAELVTQANSYAGGGGSADAMRREPLSLRASHAPTAGFRMVNAAFVLEQPPPTPPPAVAEPKPVLKVALRYNAATKAVTIRQLTNGSGQFIPNYRRVGQYMYEVRDGNTVVEVGVIPDQLFEVHGSRGGAPHATARVDAVDLVVMIPGRTVESLSTRPLQVLFYRIPASVTDRMITKASFPKLRQAGGFESWGEMALITSK